MQRLRHKGTGPPLTGNNTGSRLPNPPPPQLSRQPSNRPGPGQGPPTNPVPATPSAEAGGLINPTWDFETDFGPWFKPREDVQDPGDMNLGILDNGSTLEGM